MPRPFSNKLTPAESERLYLLIEECGEVVKAASKILRHGYESYNPNKSSSPTNREDLTRECGDVRFAMILMTCSGDLSKEEIHGWAQSKGEDVDEYYHFQPKELMKKAREEAG